MQAGSKPGGTGGGAQHVARLAAAPGRLPTCPQQPICPLCGPESSKLPSGRRWLAGFGVGPARASEWQAAAAAAAPTPPNTAGGRTDELADVVSQLGSGHGAVLSLVGLLLRTQEGVRVKIAGTALRAALPCRRISSGTLPQAVQRVQDATNPPRPALALPSPKTISCLQAGVRHSCDDRSCSRGVRLQFAPAGGSRGACMGPMQGRSRKQEAQGLPSALCIQHTLPLRSRRAAPLTPCKFGWASR